tara:strand:+ start:1288 stop:1611 length:324 start_codon:yes stop_codon:yes gene_type:complete
MQENNYLKYYRDTLFFFRDNYSLKVSDIEFLFFVYDLKYFTNTDVKNNYKCSLTFLTRNMPDLMQKGYLAIYQERARYRARKYMISQRGKLLVTKFYGILEQKEPKI